MKVVLQFLERESWWPLWVVCIGMVVLLPGLGSHGFWEPNEIRIADEASERVSAQESLQDREGVKDRGEKNRGKKNKDDDKADQDGPELTEWIIGEGIKRINPYADSGEFGARLPLALLGLIAMIATFFLTRRLASPRAGLIAAVVLASFPLFLMQTRLLMSQIGAVCGSALLVLGLVGLAWPDARRSSVWCGLDLVLVAAGAVISYCASAALLGIVVPLGAVGLACLAGLLAERQTTTQRPEFGSLWQRWHLTAAAIATCVVAVAVLVYVLSEIFVLRDQVPGERALLGYSLMPDKGYIDAVGGIWKTRDNLDATFDSLFEQIAYGLFPWSAVAPIALPHLALAPRRGRHTWSGYVLFAWAALAWIVAVVMVRKVGPVLYPAVVAVAASIGMWLDDLIAARDQADATCDSDLQARSGFGVTLRLPLVGLFVIMGVLVVGKDLISFPDKLVSLVALDGGNINYPADTALLKIPLEYWPFGFALLFASSMGAGLFLWQRCRKFHDPRPLWYRPGRYGVNAAIAVTVLLALFTSHGWIPRLSQKLSSKHIFNVYRDFRSEGDRLAIMGNAGSGPRYYADDEYTQIENRADLVELLARPNRVFALTPETQLCALHREVKQDDFYYVLDDTNAKFLLLSNQLQEGEKDINPLRRTMVRSEPQNIETRVSQVAFDDRVELIGFNMPKTVDRGDTFQMTLFFKVLKRVGGNWKIFLHFDGGSLRFQGDHKPVDTVRCSTSYWQPGDYIVDTFEVTAGNVTFARTFYNVHIGLFRGSHGNYTNMKVVPSGRAPNNPVSIDKDHRVRIGQIQVK